MANLQPNHYVLTHGDVTVNYSTTSFQGQPSLTYKAGSHTLNFTGSQIRVNHTEIGDLVSVTIQPSVDRGSTSFSFLIPVVEMANRQDKYKFESPGITTIHKTPLDLPATGVREVYEVCKLQGETAALEVPLQASSKS